MRVQKSQTSGVKSDADFLRRIEALVEPNTSLDQERANDLFARAVWARLCEPGDANAGALISALGAPKALELISAGVSPSRICAQAFEHSGLTLDHAQLSASLKRWILRLNRQASLTDLDTALKHGMRLLAPKETHWPTHIDVLGAHAPVLLWVRGDVRVFSEFSLAIVGARACTGYGTNITAEFCDHACTAGAVIVSGAAYGIDAVAHRTALARQAPTIAVLAGGADRSYPAAHTTLLTRIQAGGAVCSETVPGTAPTRWRFLQRNRLISALSQATLVTEAGIRSGSLNTAGHTAQLGRNLGAVPGPVTSETSAGCHLLIREYGASLIANINDMDELLGTHKQTTMWDNPEHPQHETGSHDTCNTAQKVLNPAIPPKRQPSSHQRILDALPLRGGRTLEDTAHLAGYALEEARAVIAELELLGCVSRCETPGDTHVKWQLLRRE